MVSDVLSKIEPKGGYKMLGYKMFNGISTFIGYLTPKLSLSKNSSGTI